MKTLIGNEYSASVTKLDRGFMGGRAGGAGASPIGSLGSAADSLSRNGPIKTNPIPFTLVANVPFAALNGNPNRAGLLIQNNDAVAALFISFQTVANAFSFQLAPGGVALFDFVTPTDPLWLFATANVAGVVLEFSKTAG